MIFTESCGESLGVISGDEADCVFRLYMAECRYG